MTELQSSINSLKEACIAAEVLLDKLEKIKKLEKPSHVWKHMDVFLNKSKDPMLYIVGYDLPEQVFCIGSCTGEHVARRWLKDAKFLFNLQEKL